MPQHPDNKHGRSVAGQNDFRERQATGNITEQEQRLFGDDQFMSGLFNVPRALGEDVGLVNPPTPTPTRGVNGSVMARDVNRIQPDIGIAGSAVPVEEAILADIFNPGPGPLKPAQTPQPLTNANDPAFLEGLDSIMSPTPVDVTGISADRPVTTGNSGSTGESIMEAILAFLNSANPVTTPKSRP